MQLVIVSGRSGSGKSISLHVLEDIGFYCIDNLPISLLPTLTKEVSKQYERIAISLDVRNIPDDTAQLENIIAQLQQLEKNFTVFYLDANDNTLIKRFSETRRRHPLTSDTMALQEALDKEREILYPLDKIAQHHIQTDSLSIHQLRDILKSRLSNTEQPPITLMFQSFGFKYGIPDDSDFIFDVRCLPNPYWKPELRQYSGKDSEVIQFLETQPKTNKMFQDITQFLSNWLPAFIDDNRKYLTVSIGCTGGQHRSVYMTEKLGQFFKENQCTLQIRHRELSARHAKPLPATEK